MDSVRRVTTQDLVIRGGSERAGGPGDEGPPLAATLYLPTDAPDDEALPGLVVGHGAGSRRTRHDGFCRQACAEGLAVLALDFRGHGDSGGRMDGPLDDDVLAAVGSLRRHPRVDGRRIGYRGSSMGGYYGLLAAKTADLSAAALVCPASAEVMLRGLDRLEAEAEAFSDDGLSLRVDQAPLRAFLESHPTLEAAAHVSCPVLLAHARGDEVVPLAHTLRIAERLAGPTEVIITAGGDHRSLQASTEMHRRVAVWLRERLG